MTETELAQELKVDQSTISRDIKMLKELSQRFVFDLAKFQRYLPLAARLMIDMQIYHLSEMPNSRFHRRTVHTKQYH